LNEVNVLGSKRKIRVLHCPAIVAGNAQHLARAERELGIESWAVAFVKSPFGYETDEVLWDAKDNAIMREIKRWRLLSRALKGFDIVHFNFGRSIMPYWVPTSGIRRVKPLSIRRWLHWRAYQGYAGLFELRDLPLLKFAGKGIVVTYQGDDARQGDFCRANFEINPESEVEAGYYSSKSDSHKRFFINKFAKYADRIYALNPDLLWVLPPHARFLPYSHIDLRDWRPVDNGNLGPKVPVILHVPSHRGVKGTKYILDVISRLKRGGVPLELRLVEGVSHGEARRIYESADLLIDQLVCGWYGGIAVELMALGKPVICYIREGDLKFIPEQMRKDLPIINAIPTTIHEVLKEWLTSRRHELPEIGRRGRAYVERWHDPLKIAAKLKSEYEAVMASKQRKK
jgi:glycosyltransferase involved in cell wall biosynthesis